MMVYQREANKTTQSCKLRADLVVLLIGALLVAAGAAQARTDFVGLATEVAEARLDQDLQAMVSQGSRVAGYPGNARAADYIIEQFQQLGIETLVQEFNLPAPLDEGAQLQVGDKSYELACFWPNLVRTSQVPPEGISGELIYVGRGNLSDYNRKSVAGSIVLLDFNTAQNWLNAPLLGAAAVVFIEPAVTTRGEAEMKFLRVPVAVPRFYIAADDADEILAAIRQGEVAGRLRARQVWEDVVNRNIIGIIPGSDPELRNEAIIIEAHYDSISVVPKLSPGAENAVGICALLEMARLMAANPPRRSVILLATSGHFQALAGAREFVALWGREPRKERYRTKQLDELNKELKRLERQKERLAKAIAEAKTRTGAVMALGQIARTAGMVVVGQLEISLAQADERDERLDRDIERKRNEISIWQRLNEFDEIKMFIALDLSTKSGTLGVFNVGHYYEQVQFLRFYSPVGKQFASRARDVALALGITGGQQFVDGINPIKGREWHTFFPGKVAFDHEMAIRGGRPGIVFTTVNDSRSLVDTPLDTYERLDRKNMYSQVRLLYCLLVDFLNDETLSQQALKRVDALKKLGELITINGTILEFRRRESFVPNTPVPQALVVVQGTSRMMMGVHTTVATMANETSEFSLRGEAAVGLNLLEAYRFDPQDGSIVYAPDLGPDGEGKYPRAVKGRAGLKRPVIVFRCAATDIYDLVDERYFQTLEKLFIYDAKDFSEPVSYGYSLSQSMATTEFPSYVEPCAVVYAQPQTHVQVTMGMGLLGVRMVLINASADKPTGAGFLASATPRIALTPLQVAHDMWTIDDHRMSKLREHGVIGGGTRKGQEAIRPGRIEELHHLAKTSLDLAKAELADRQYDKAMAAARHAWGYESRAYPDVQKTALDVVKGVLFYLAMLLPFAYFGERLLIASRTIIGQIVGTLVVFIIVFLMLAFVHPAFSLTATPPIILLAFIIMALAVLVIAIVTMKFNEQLKAMKQSRGGVHEADVGRLSATAAAFHLGIANMRRRKARTALTATTLIVLTFTVLSFTAVKSKMRTNRIQLSYPPAYSGMMLRDRAWLSLEAPTADIIANEMGEEAIVAPRAWYTSADIQKELMIDVGLADDPASVYTINTIIGLSAQEREILDIEQALVAGRWMQAGEKNVALLPLTVASGLGITSDDVGSAWVTVFGTRFRVIGLLSEDRLRRLKDLDGEPLMPVNYALLRPEIVKELQRQAEQRSQLGTTSAQSLLQEYKHYGPEKVVVLPYSTILELGGTLRSVAIRHADPEAVAPVVEDMMKRFALSLYAGIGPRSYLFSSVGMTAVRGMETLLIPMLIAALIVLNTMLGAVYERTREIGIYSSLGLAPSHIGALFLAESAVFANLGAIIGYLIGQILARILFATGNTAGIELNYSSTAAVSVTIVVMAVVLLSTLYPSRKAAEIASPGIERKWSLPEPEGDYMHIRLPFTVTGRDAFGVSAFLKEYFDEYVGYAGGEFLAEDVRLEPMTTPEGEGMAVKLRMWLAPYDLGVSQEFELDCHPTGDLEIFEIVIHLQRIAGDITSWKKTNSLFLGAVRKQFLIWRTVPIGEKVDYAERADALLHSTA